MKVKSRYVDEIKVEMLMRKLKRFLMEVPEEDRDEIVDTLIEAVKEDH